MELQDPGAYDAALAARLNDEFLAADAAPKELRDERLPSPRSHQ